MLVQTILVRLGLFLALAAAPQESAPKSFEEVRAEARGLLVKDLELYASWCTRRTLFAERDRVCERILGYDSDHEQARLMLDYHRGKGGQWEVAPDRKPGKDFDKKALAKDAPRELGKVVLRFRGHLLAWVDAHPGALAPEAIDSAYDEILSIDPADAEVHRRRGEVSLEERWVIPETVRARERRPWLRDLVKRSVAEVPVAEKAPPKEFEESMGISWSARLATPLVRVLCAGEPAEAERAARSIGAAAAVFRELFGVEPGLPSGCSVYLLRGSEEGAAFLAAYPLLDESARDALRGFEGAGLGHSGDVAYWSADEAQRLDGALRVILAWFCAERLGLTLEMAWLHEGLGLYLTRELVGTRLTWFVRPSPSLSIEEDTKLRARLFEPKTNWIDEAFQVLSREPEARPRLDDVMKKKGNELATEDVLLVYALAAYLIEGRPDELRAIAARVGAGEASALVTSEVLGLGPEALEARLARWLGERH